MTWSHIPTRFVQPSARHSGSGDVAAETSPALRPCEQPNSIGCLTTATAPIFPMTTRAAAMCGSWCIRWRAGPIQSNGSKRGCLSAHHGLSERNEPRSRWLPSNILSDGEPTRWGNCSASPTMSAARSGSVPSGRSTALRLNGRRLDELRTLSASKRRGAPPALSLGCRLGMTRSTRKHRGRQPASIAARGFAGARAVAMRLPTAQYRMSISIAPHVVAQSFPHSSFVNSRARGEIHAQVRVLVLHTTAPSVRSAGAPRSRQLAIDLADTKPTRLALTEKPA